MNARKIFGDILNQVEASKLNYFISKTPFSANISLKCSFVQFHDKPDPEQVQLGQHCDAEATVKSEVIIATSDNCDKLEKEIVKLKSKLISLENTISQQKHVIEAKSEEFKNSEKSAEDKAAVFRDEVLKVKKDKNKLATMIKSLEDENEMFKNETENLKMEKQKLAEENQVLVRNVKSLKIDQATHDDLTHNLEQKLEKESVRLKYQCEICDHKSKTHGELRKHQQTQHCKDQNHQVELMKNQTELAIVEKEATFEEFLCFYCEILIRNREDLEMHRSWCDPIPLTDFPCDKCGVQCLSEEQLEIHKNSYHTKDSYLDVSGQSNEENFESCDFCGNKFGTLGGLRSHIRSIHKEKLPT